MFRQQINIDGKIGLIVSLYTMCSLHRILLRNKYLHKLMHKLSCKLNSSFFNLYFFITNTFLIKTYNSQLVNIDVINSQYCNNLAF